MVVSLINPVTSRERLRMQGFETKLNPGAALCEIKGCRNKHAGTKKIEDVFVCHRHYQAIWRYRNPKQDAFANLRTHAAARRIPFTLTFARFVEVTDVEGFWYADPASHGEVLSIDRIRMSEGYHDANVQVLTVSENAIKGNRERWLPENVKAILARKRAQPAWQVTGAREDSWLD